METPFKLKFFLRYLSYVFLSPLNYNNYHLCKQEQRIMKVKIKQGKNG